MPDVLWLQLAEHPHLFIGPLIKHSSSWLKKIAYLWGSCTLYPLFSVENVTDRHSEDPDLPTCENLYVVFFFFLSPSQIMERNDPKKKTVTFKSMLRDSVLLVTSTEGKIKLRKRC